MRRIMVWLSCLRIKFHYSTGDFERCMPYFANEVQILDGFIKASSSSARNTTLPFIIMATSTCNISSAHMFS